MCHPGWGRARAEAQHLKDLARLRGVRDRIDREYARPLDVEALAHDADMPAGQLARRFRRAYGRSPHAYVTARRIERAAALMCRDDLGTHVRLRACDTPTTGFRGFALSLTVSQPSVVNGYVEAAVGAGAAGLKPAAKSLPGYGGVVRAPDGTVWKVATSGKKDEGPAAVEFDETVSCSEPARPSPTRTGSPGKPATGLPAGPDEREPVRAVRARISGPCRSPASSRSSAVRDPRRSP
ncbi:hypothetical protein OV450_0129 [Actinobacteria bacterium OV450]|nr:hypothetical protein OV450_0129 [Actinobacteria bacterium OV450]